MAPWGSWGGVDPTPLPCLHFLNILYPKPIINLFCLLFEHPESSQEGVEAPDAEGEDEERPCREAEVDEEDDVVAEDVRLGEVEGRGEHLRHGAPASRVVQRVGQVLLQARRNNVT